MGRIVYKKGTKYRIYKSINVDLNGNIVKCYTDNFGDEVEIIKEKFKCDDITYYLVKNLTKGYNQYVPSTILIKIE